MICSQAKDWLLQAALPEELAIAPPDVAAHIRQCDDCQRLIQQLHRMERVWDEQPLPESAELVREQFLARQAIEPPRPAARRFRAVVLARWAVAASVLLCIGLTVFMMSSPRQVHAESDVVEQLIDWNLQMSELSTPAEREKLYTERVAALKDDLAKSRISDDDRQFAETLLTNGQWLRSSTEPLEEADRFNQLADQIVDRVEVAAARRDAAAARKNARQYSLITSKGINAKLERAEAAKAARAAKADAAFQRKMERLLAREENRLKKLEVMHKNAADPARKEIRKMLEQTKSKPKKNPPKKPQVTG
jgi:hypothetical protein